MSRRQISLWSPAIGAEGGVLAYGHYGKPLLAFPSQQGNSRQYEDNGMIEALAGPLDTGLVKIYAVDSFDSGSWYRGDLPLEERARLHGCYEDWILNQVVPWIQADSHAAEIAVTGVSFGAYHAANFALKHATRLPARALPERRLRRFRRRRRRAGRRRVLQQSQPTTSPRSAATTSTGCAVASTSCSSADRAPGRTRPGRSRAPALRPLLGEKGIPHELDVWGHDVPHDWPAWRAQIAHHLPRFL